jgi:hypothetical protein
VTNRSAQKSDYDGVLMKKMTPRYPSLLDPEGQEARALEEYFERVVALFRHYKINPKDEDAWMHLALALAHNHVPGFTFGRERGAPHKRGVDDIIIWSQVKRHEAKGLTVNNACRLIEKQGIVKGLKAQSIRQRYYDFSKGPLGAMFENVESQVGRDRFQQVIIEPFTEDVLK